LALLALLVFAFVAACAAPAIGSIGAMLGKDVHTGRLFVREVPPGMAAAEAGVRDGDEVIAIDGTPVDGMAPLDVHQRLEGAVGTRVVLSVVRNGETKKVEIVRGPLAKP
jgi:C-terminal processing protease CtpA/Prc